MPARRTFLQWASSFPLLGAMVPKAAAAPAPRDYFAELGVRTFINAAGTYTTLSGSLMQPEVVAAIAYASKQFAALPELQDKVGARIAGMLGAEAAMVTSGAAGALTVGTAACLTGTKTAAILQLPDLTGLKSEVIVQKSHRYAYDHAVRATGVRMIEVESAAALEQAVSSQTAMMLFFHAAEPKGSVTADQFVALGKKHNVPTMIDVAANVPPLENLTKHLKMGFDLVAISGGKGIRGPQSAGLLYGRKDLIAAARLNTSPYSDSLARGQKVNKEEMLGMMVALESYIKRDHQADWREWERRVRLIAESLASVPGVTTETWIPQIADQVPHPAIRLDPAKIRITPPEAMEQLRTGKPSIEACPATDRERLVIGVWMMQPGEAEVVAGRLRALIKSAAV